MGASLYAYLEYDDAPAYYRRGEVPAAFAHGTDRVIDLTTNVGITGAKDYLFIGVLGGPRNPRGIPPLIQPRGLPDRVNWRIAQEFAPADGNTGWLLLPEIEAAPSHAQVQGEELCFGVQMALGIMRLLAARMGPDRVRLVFQMTD
jgi:hypothetical protein